MKHHSTTNELRRRARHNSERRAGVLVLREGPRRDEVHAYARMPGVQVRYGPGQHSRRAFTRMQEPHDEGDVDREDTHRVRRWYVEKGIDADKAQK